MKQEHYTFDYAKEICKSEKLSSMVFMLYERWLNEKEYEDIKEYGQWFEKNLGFNKNTLIMTKRPFGFKFKSTFGKTKGVSHVMCNIKSGYVQLSAKFTPTRG